MRYPYLLLAPTCLLIALPLISLFAQPKVIVADRSGEGVFINTGKGPAFRATDDLVDLADGKLGLPPLAFPWVINSEVIPRNTDGNFILQHFALRKDVLAVFGQDGRRIFPDRYELTNMRTIVLDGTITDMQILVDYATPENPHVP